MTPAKDEYHHCPHCRRETRHFVVRERVLAPVLWCLSCFRTRVLAEEAAAGAHFPFHRNRKDLNLSTQLPPTSQDHVP